MIPSSLVITTYNWPEALSLCLDSVLLQRILPFEVIIADDGSDINTTRLIDSYREKFPVPLNHFWQEDKGYRINSVRNLAIKKSKYPYIIQIDGDVILDPDFIADHLHFASRRGVIMGRRVQLDRTLTNRLLKKEVSIELTSFRSKLICLLHNYLLYSNKSVRGLRGCNVSFWKRDAIRVNGYDEDLTSKGPNDKEFGIRLINSGVSAFNMKFYGIQYHLKHDEGNRRSDYASVLKAYNESKSTKKIKCKNGIV